MKDALLIPYKLPKNLQEVEPQLLPYVTLNKIMTCQYENGLCCYDKSVTLDDSDSDSEDDDDDDDDDEKSGGEDENDNDNKKSRGKDKDDKKNDGNSYIDDDDTKSDSEDDNDSNTEDGKKSNREGDNDKKEQDKCIIHPLDNLLTQIKFSDNILRQNIMSKLSVCQVAIPLLLPDHSNNTVTFLLWAMRSILKQWKVQSDEKYIESPIVEYSSPVISFLRIGSLHLSKSDILNHVIGEFKFFFYRGCKRVKSKKILSEGLIDLCCYLPGSSTDKFSCSTPILFFNLHGDAKNSKKQVKFIQKVSALMIVFIKKSKINDSTTQLINNVAKNNRTILFVEKNCDKKMKNTSFNKNVKCISFNIGKPMDYFQDKIQKNINEAVEKCRKTVKLNECSEIARSCEIFVDEDDEDCQNGYKCAKSILDQIKCYPPMEAKLTLFPLQGSDCWQRWAELDRKQHKEFGKQTVDLEKYNAEKDAEKMKIREEMQHYCNSLTEAVQIFLDALLKFDGITRHYFLGWLKLLLDEYNRKVLVSAEYSTEIISVAMISLDHFFREMGHIYETVACQQKEFGKNTSVLKYPRAIVELMADGYCMEIMDGDTTHVPVEWVSAVFKELQYLYNDSKVCTVSIVGIQSTGKSTLLNTMFGVNFNVSAGRCTRGAFIQLLTFHKDAKNVSNCDHLLLIDTEGLRSPELHYTNKEYDNELATFVVGLADVAIINMLGDNHVELSNILQTVTHGLIRINKIEISPSCKFVYHLITEPGAESKTARGRKRSYQILDESVQKACELELCEGKFNSFSDFMKFSETEDVLYFASLWHGNPPMAKINTEYTKEAKKFKISLINRIGQLKISYCSFGDFSIKINTLWNAVLREQFLFSFKNTVELLIRKEYDQKHGEWNAEFRLDFLEWENQAKVLFHKNASQDAHDREKMLLEEVQKILEQKKEMILKKRDKYFEENKYSKILAEWKAKSDDKINSYCQDYIEWAKGSIKRLIIECENGKEAQRIRQTIYKELDRHAVKLFTSNPNIRLCDKDLENSFNEKWFEWLEEITPVEHKSAKEIEHHILEILQEHFKLDMGILNQKLLNTPLAKWNSEFKLNPDIHLLINQDPSMPHLTNAEIFTLTELLTSDWLNNFTKCMVEAQKTCTYQGMLHQFDQQLSELIKNFEEAKQTHPFLQFTRDCVFDMTLTVSKQTRELVVSFEEKAKDSEVKVELAKHKNTYMKFFFVTYDNILIKHHGLTQKQIMKRSRKSSVSLLDEEEICNTQAKSTQKGAEASLELDKEVSEEKQANEHMYDDDVIQDKSLNETDKETDEIKIPVTNEQNEQATLQADNLIDSHTRVIEYLCDILGNAVTKTLKELLMYEIYKDITASNFSFKNKGNFKSSVLTSLLDSECFDEYKVYFTDPEKSFKKWMCFYVNEHCLKNAKFHQMTDCTCQDLIESVQEAISETCIDSSNLSFSSWINDFFANMPKKIENVCLLEHDIQSICKFNIPWISVDDAKAFKDLFSKQVNANLIKVNSQELYNNMEDELTDYMWRNLKKTLLGCTIHCPFCMEMCDADEGCNENEKHIHSVKLHRPQCLGKIIQHPTRNLVVDVCTTLVGSNVSKFRNKDSKWQWKLYKHYETMYPTWLIPTTTKSIESYWLWVVARFGKDIAKWCGNGKIESIPKEWYKITKEVARGCLNLHES